MANKDLFAPPTKEEVSSAQASPRGQDLFAPPSKEEVGTPGLLDSMKIAAKNTLPKIGQMLDYPGGLMRTGLASVGGLMSGKTNVVTPEDVGAAFKGQAPSSAQYLDRMGLSEGPSAELPVVGKTSLRDIEGLALDTITDPLTLLSKGSKALNPIGAGVESSGKSIYKSGFKKIDEKLLEQGKKPLSDLMLAEGKTGTTKTIQKDARKIADAALSERDTLYKRANDLGVSVDLGFPLANAEAKIADIAKNPGQRDLAEKLSGFLDLYKKEGKVPVDALSDWKSALYDSLPESAYAGAKVKGAAKQFEKALAKDFKEAIAGAANTAESGLGDKINALNEQMSTVLGSDKAIKAQARRATTTNAISPVDVITGGLGGAGLLAGKKAADLSKTTFARTTLGKGLMDLGKSGTLDAASKRGLINAIKAKQGLINPGLLNQDDYRLGDR